MRLFFSLLLASRLATVPAVAGQSPPATSDHRARVIAALQRLMETGEPLDTEYGEGAWLQMAVDIASVANDREIVRLAQRAAAPLLPHVSSPVASIADRPVFELRHPIVLRLRKPVTSTAEIFASLDGGERFRVGEAPRAGTSLSILLPQAALAPGLHHLRLQAHIVYSGSGDVPPPETRNLPELTYALYDSGRENPLDARRFITSPLSARAQQLDPALPDEPFSTWLMRELSPHAPNAHVQWASRCCDDRLGESGALPKTRHLCSVGYFGVEMVIGQIWVRTGRSELTDTEVRWLAEAPTFEAFTLLQGAQTDPKSAPPENASRIVEKCGGLCRGY